MSTDAHTISVSVFSARQHVQNSFATPAGLYPFFTRVIFPGLKRWRLLFFLFLVCSAWRISSTPPPPPPPPPPTPPPLPFPPPPTSTLNRVVLSLWARFVLHTNKIYIMHHHNHVQGGDLDAAFRLHLISLSHFSFLLVFENLILLANYNSNLFLEDPSYHIYIYT